MVITQPITSVKWLGYKLSHITMAIQERSNSTYRLWHPLRLCHISQGSCYYRSSPDQRMSALSASWRSVGFLGIDKLKVTDKITKLLVSGFIKAFCLCVCARTPVYEYIKLHSHTEKNHQTIEICTFLIIKPCCHFILLLNFYLCLLLENLKIVNLIQKWTNKLYIFLKLEQFFIQLISLHIFTHV